MFQKSAMLYLYVETPLHAGSGTSLGVVDLPVQRERVTGYPLVQSSGIKGKLRAEAYCQPEFVRFKNEVKQRVLPKIREEDKQRIILQFRQQMEKKKRAFTTDEIEELAEKEIDKRAENKARKQAAQEKGLEAVFGPETDEASEHAGAFVPSDARLLLFPVRSLLGVFAWTTSKDVLARFCRDAKAMGIGIGWNETGPPDDKNDTALVAPGSDIAADGKIVLEEFAFSAQEDQAVKAIAEWLAKNALPDGGEYDYWRKKLPQSLVILPQNAFRDFTQFATEVINRIKLDNQTKTATSGALWSEEHLPTDTLLYAPLMASSPRTGNGRLPKGWKGEAEEVMRFVLGLDIRRVQLGGDETVGRGMVRLRFSNGGK
jgi:CRISPR-associated protein Cmr4